MHLQPSGRHSPDSSVSKRRDARKSVPAEAALNFYHQCPFAFIERRRLVRQIFELVFPEAYLDSPGS